MKLARANFPAAVCIVNQWSMTPDIQLATRSFDLAEINRVILAGWAGRDTAGVEAHIRELEALGMPRPTRTPIFYRVAASLLTHSSVIEVVGEETSGEVEFIIVRRDDGLWIGVGSDHTDRGLERTSVALSKQLCAKPVANTLWPYASVASRWDSLMLRAWVFRGETRTLYQEAKVTAILSPEDLIAKYEASSESFTVGSALFSGTVTAIGGIAPADAFEFELEDPVEGQRLRHQYKVVTLPVNA
jgi:hypothetical protein